MWRESYLIFRTKCPISIHAYSGTYGLITLSLRAVSGRYWLSTSNYVVQSCVISFSPTLPVRNILTMYEAAVMATHLSSK